MRSVTVAVVTAALASAAAHADVTTVANITADNHYALFTAGPGGLVYLGGNEIGPSGSQGGYNWSMAETYNAAMGTDIYVAVWSDTSVAQGFLASFQSSQLSLLSGDSRWRVFGTGLAFGDYSAHPTVQMMGQQIATADSNNAWETPYVGGTNGISPWGTIANIEQDAAWMWRADGTGGNALSNGSISSEMIIFHAAVPSPGTAALAGVALLAGMGSRRRPAPGLKAK
jgi:hypothetical protein